MLAALLLLYAVLSLCMAALVLRADPALPARIMGAIFLCDAVAAAARGALVLHGATLPSLAGVVLRVVPGLVVLFLALSFVYTFPHRRSVPWALRLLFLGLVLLGFQRWLATSSLGALYVLALPTALLAMGLIGRSFWMHRARHEHRGSLMMAAAFLLRWTWAGAITTAIARGVLPTARIALDLAIADAAVLLLSDAILAAIILRHGVFRIGGVVTEALLLATMIAGLIAVVLTGIELSLRLIQSPLPLRLVLLLLALVPAALVGPLRWARSRLETALLAQNQALEARTQHMAQELQTARPLAALGTLAAAIAHDIRTPLTSVQMNVQILRRKAQLPPDDIEHLDIALEEILRLNDKVSEILEFAKPIVLRRVPSELSEIVEEASRALAPLQESRRVAVRMELPPLPPLSVDPGRLRTVFENLLENAIQASSAGAGADAEVLVRGQLASDHVIIAVADRGKGIAPAHLHRLFEPFFTTRDDGTGLGLAIVQKLVQAHGGSVSVATELGQGSTFTVRLPVI